MFCGFVGLAVLNALGSRRNLLRNALLAPGVGAGVVILLAFWWNRLGFGQRSFAPWLAGGLLIGSAVLFWWRRTPFPWRRYAPFAVVLCASAAVTGSPMLRYGLDWISVANEDMTNYVLSAQYYAEKGRTASPDWGVLRKDTDLVEYSYFVQHSSSTRFASELLLAVTGEVSHIGMLPVFMPVLLALNLALVSAVGAMVVRRKRRWRALLGCALAAVFPLMTFGVTYQLIAQVFGLGLLAVCATLLLDPWRVKGWREVVLAAVLLAALLLTYPELLPILALAAALWFGVLWLQKKWPGPALARLALGGAGALVMLNFYVPELVRFLLRQGGEAVSGKNEVMPFFLLPTAGLHLWGLLPFTGFQNYPHLLAVGIAGMALTLAALATALRQARRAYPAALVMVALAAAAVVIVGSESGFGAFKVASYVQPFLAAVVATGWLPSRWPGRTPIAWIHLACGAGALIFVVCFEVPTLRGLVTDSTGERSAAVNIPHASELRLATELERTSKNSRPPAFLSNSSNPSLLKLYGLYLRGTPLSTPAVSLYKNEVPGPRLHIDTFDYGDQSPPAQFYHDTRVAAAALRQATALVSTPDVTVLNRSHFTGEINEVFESIGMQKVRNLLTYVSTDRGLPWMEADKRRVGLFQVEADPFGVDSSLSALGRYLLFRVDNPVAGSRLVMDLTTLNRLEQDRQLPQPVVIGENRSTMEFEGTGSGRLVSAPIQFRKIDGVDYFGIDMGAVNTTPIKSRSPLMSLWERQLAVDARPRIAMARNISLLREDEVESLPVPRQVGEFPGDLFEPSFEYSGISEDGWLGNRVLLRLRATEASSPLTIQGWAQGPEVGGASRVTARVDGRDIGTRELAKGDFTWRINARADQGVRNVELEFDRVKRISFLDGRLVSIRLECAGFGTEACLSNPDDIVLMPGPVLLGRGWGALEGPQGGRFREAAGVACVELRSTTAAGASLETELEPLPAAGTTGAVFDLLAEDKQIAERRVDGRSTLEFPLPAGLRGGTQLCLVSPQPAQAAQQAPPTRAFRAYSIIGPEDTRRQESGDIVEWPVRVLSGWYPIEKWEGETFRWINTDASIYIPRGMHRLEMEIALGPGLAGKPLQAELVDNRGRRIAAFTATKREVIRLDLPAGTHGRLMFRVKNKGVLFGIDPRILNFRVFWLRAR